MNTKSVRRPLLLMVRVFYTLVLVVFIDLIMGPMELSADEASSKGSMKRLPTYFPNTEMLQPDEMRIIALGTGLPTPITRAQKSTAWMVELGNGDVFLFDIGTGSMENLFGLRPDFSRIDKIFLSHLHSDHFGDLDAFIIGSWLSGRYTPLHVYGGSGETPELSGEAKMSKYIMGGVWKGFTPPPLPKE